MATTPRAGSDIGMCAKMRHEAELSAKELKDKRKKLSDLQIKLTQETDPIKTQQLKEEIERLKNEIELDDAQLGVLQEEILFHCSGH
ncbi:hypothetical protein [Streptomyces sp. NRRL B-3229]|uniref:hypothetical protein n=1 Tax=Streptomyces sp. NRRL B-3229 TaxID=1463836 RepID=UPI00131EC733|nr:hypothetical protein [Streptomyces sp. NRRL B-3229]